MARLLLATLVFAGCAGPNLVTVDGWTYDATSVCVGAFCGEIETDARSHYPPEVIAGTETRRVVDPGGGWLVLVTTQSGARDAYAYRCDGRCLPVVRLR